LTTRRFGATIIITIKKEGKMLELIGFLAIIYVVVKYFPEILKFTVYAVVVVIALYFLIGGLLWIFGASIAINMNTQLMGI
tara:strand:+ start:259 stop:501 length:243 start_codon:yes stop_codon:yes gene_type:complete